MSFPAYPAHLKNADWQKQKGTFAKVFKGKTGIGEAMNKAVAAYDKLDQAKLHALMTYKSMDELNAAVAACKAELSKTEAVRKELYALRDVAKKAAADFKKNKLIPASTTAHVEKIAKDADFLGVAIKSYDPSADFEKAKKNVEAKLAMAATVLKGGIQKVRAGMKSIEKQPTPELYESKVWQLVRAAAAGVPLAPALKPVAPLWKTLSSKTKGDLKDEAGVKKHFVELEALMKSTEKLLG
ncbi:MAG TPA: hypothetical protein VLU41_05910 [Ideonella sp.]|nr:hypothetical protein [Ideonella sp.]